jgi:Fe-S-cluster containining protein
MTPPEVAAEAKRLMAEKIKLTGRSCGACTLCCKVMAIDEPELKKPEGDWCKHCKPGKGCAIYELRPPLCQAFACTWLVDPSLGPEWYPKRCKMVLHVTENASAGRRLDVNVDASYPNAWREAPYFDELKRISRGVPVRVYVGQKMTILSNGEEREDISRKMPGPDSR